MKRNLLAVSCMLALVALRGGFAIAEDAPADKAEKAPKAAPAAPTVSKEDVAAGNEVVREAKAFLALLRDGADEKAYERMSGEFRKEHTAEEFAKDAGDFRDKSPMPPTTSLRGDVWLKPTDGGPPRASLRTGISTAAILSGAARVAGRGMRPVTLTLGLVREDGKWKVASVHDMRTNDAAISMGKSPKIDRKDSGHMPVSSSLEGKIVKVEDGSLVLRLEGGRNVGPVTERELKLDEQTAVANAVETEALRGRAAPALPTGAKAPRAMRITQGTLSDVKVDHRATVEPSDDGTRAEAVMVMQESDAKGPSEGL
jgi:hypothetical protein